MKRILVGLDASPRAPTVLAAARQLAEVTSAKLILYRAIGLPPDVPLEVLMHQEARLEDLLVAGARHDLERLAHELPSGLLEKIEVTPATGWDGICRAGREHAVDLIVIGSHGYAGLDRLLGTTAAKVVNHADRNVLVVRTLL